MKITDLIKKNALRNIPPATHATFATHEPTVASVATVAKREVQKSKLNIPIKSNQEPQVDNSYCWPNSSAFNSYEIALTTERMLFLRSRLSMDDAERMADRLIARDREWLDMTYCFECQHLEGYGSGPWRCTNAIRAEVNCFKKVSAIPRDWPWMLMRCAGFCSLLDQQITDEQPATQLLQAPVDGFKD
jgi:hypothetical protein